jgi:hypothetical protein
MNQTQPDGVMYVRCILNDDLHILLYSNAFVVSFKGGLNLRSFDFCRQLLLSQLDTQLNKRG